MESQKWIDSYKELEKNTFVLLVDLQFDRSKSGGKVRTTVKTTPKQQLIINDNITLHNTLKKSILLSLDSFPIHRTKYLGLENDFDSYLQFNRVGNDLSESDWKIIFIKEFSLICESIIAFIQELEEVINAHKDFICFRSAEKCSINPNRTENSVFVIMPFDPAFDDIYLLGIKEPLQNMGYHCSRADEIFHSHDILCQGICKQIQEASYIIADMTQRNANVFFELGLCYGFEKKVLLIAKEVEDIPFDLRSMQSIIYKGKIGILRNNLIKYLDK